jgi:hypothetical protein
MATRRALAHLMMEHIGIEYIGIEYFAASGA